MTITTYHTTKKSYLYNFFPIKEEEERLAANYSIFSPPCIHRMMVEIRDIHPPPEINPYNPWQIKKTLNHFEIGSGNIIVSFQDTFEHILRYWTIFMASYVTMFGHRVAVSVLDVTNERNPRKYEGNHVCFQMTANESCLLTCPEMMKDRNLKVDDSIGLYWEPREGLFRFKLLSSSGRYTFP